MLDFSQEQSEFLLNLENIHCVPEKVNIKYPNFELDVCSFAALSNFDDAYALLFFIVLVSVFFIIYN